MMPHPEETFIATLGFISIYAQRETPRHIKSS